MAIARALFGGVLVYLGVAACTAAVSSRVGGAVATAQADPTSGSRLKAAFYVSADGAKGPAGYFVDTGRNGEHCTFGTAPDGMTRCMPPMAGVALFGDANCTTPVASAPLCDPPPAYALVPPSAQCATAKIYTVQTAQHGGATYTFNAAANTCTELPASGYTSTRYYDLGTAVDPSAFQAGMVQTD